MKRRSQDNQEQSNVKKKQKKSSVKSFNNPLQNTKQNQFIKILKLRQLGRQNKVNNLGVLFSKIQLLMSKYEIFPNLMRYQKTKCSNKTELERQKSLILKYDNEIPTWTFCSGLYNFVFQVTVQNQGIFQIGLSRAGQIISDPYYKTHHKCFLCVYKDKVEIYRHDYLQETIFIKLLVSQIIQMTADINKGTLTFQGDMIPDKITIEDVDFALKFFPALRACGGTCVEIILATGY